MKTRYLLLMTLLVSGPCALAGPWKDRSGQSLDFSCPRRNDIGGTGPAARQSQVNLRVNNFLDTSRFSSLRARIEAIAAGAKGTFGIAVRDLSSGDTLSINGNGRFPMQSVYKFPLAMYVLHLVDMKKLSLSQLVRLSKDDLSIPYASPLRDKYPEGNVEVSLAELLSYTVSQSDNNGCDKLFEICGGTGALNDYLHGIGISQVAVVATEKQMGVDSKVQYTNWCWPSAMAQLLEKFDRGTLLSKKGSDYLRKLMLETVNAPKRIKGNLPPGTLVAHKPGTSGTDRTGFTATTNDVGIVELADGHKFAIVLYLMDSMGSQNEREGAMAAITRLIFDSYR